MDSRAVDAKPAVDPIEGFLAEVRSLVDARLRATTERVGLPGDALEGLVGKMLRSRLGARLAAAAPATGKVDEIVAGCAAVEILHTATLCHDDVIDRSALRRHRPTLWRSTSTNGAILVGDLLLTESLRVLQDRGFHRGVGQLLGKMTEVCSSELEQEFRHRTRAVDRATWLRLGREKTGALFAFVGLCGAGDDATLGAALEESGYRVGTAYQIIDDLIDIVGCEEATGKSTGRDADTGVVTRLATESEPAALASEALRAECQAALDAVAAWPALRAAVAGFLAEDVEPLLRAAVPGWTAPLASRPE